MNWIPAIVAALLTMSATLLACLVGVVYTHWSKQHDFLKDRLEKFTFHLLDLRELTGQSNLTTLIARNSEPNEADALKYFDTINPIALKIAALTRLFFPSLVEQCHTISSEATMIFAAAQRSDPDERLDLIVQRASEVSRLTDALLSELIRDQNRLTKAVPTRIKNAIGKRLGWWN